MNTHEVFHCLGERTRLNAMQLLLERGELCVCELVAALGESQPKVSRHLALLRNCGLLADERRGQWVYYRLHPALPAWVLEVVGSAASVDEGAIAGMLQRLARARNGQGNSAEEAMACA